MNTFECEREEYDRDESVDDTFESRLCRILSVGECEEYFFEDSIERRV